MVCVAFLKIAEIIVKFLLTNRDIWCIISLAVFETARYAPLAQLVEHLTLNQGVPGSSP